LLCGSACVLLLFSCPQQRHYPGTLRHGAPQLKLLISLTAVCAKNLVFEYMPLNLHAVLKHGALALDLAVGFFFQVVPHSISSR
jgi:hypothetical protein